ncbi:MAG: hypothetical protein WCH34_04210 [Bacteroidota bacterium]
MDKGKHFLFCILLFGVGAVLFFQTSCKTPKCAAKQFVKQTDSICLLLLPSSYIIKNNLKLNDIEDFDSLDDEIKDSLSATLTLFLNSINDSLFQTSFYSEIVSEMKSLGYRVYGPSQIIEFITKPPGNTYVVEIVQLQLEEFSEWYDVDYDFVLPSQQNDFLLNGITLSVWLKEAKANSDSSNRILFSEYTNKDKLKGQYSLDFNTGDMFYLLKSKSYLEQSHVDSLWLPAAKQVSQYLSDYYMNNFVSKQFKGNINLPYYSYNATKHKVKIARSGRFIIM